MALSLAWLVIPFAIYFDTLAFKTWQCGPRMKPTGNVRKQWDGSNELDFGLSIEEERERNVGKERNVGVKGRGRGRGGKNKGRRRGDKTVDYFI